MCVFYPIGLTFNSKAETDTSWGAKEAISVRLASAQKFYILLWNGNWVLTLSPQQTVGWQNGESWPGNCPSHDVWFVVIVETEVDMFDIIR